MCITAFTAPTSGAVSGISDVRSFILLGPAHLQAEHRPEELIQSEDIGEWLFVSEALLSFSLHFANG
jgi:hypothetical protein